MPGETGGCERSVIMNINRRMMAGGGLDGGQDDDEGGNGWRAKERNGSGGPGTTGWRMKMTPGIRRLPSFNFN